MKWEDNESKTGQGESRKRECYADQLKGIIVVDKDESVG